MPIRPTLRRNGEHMITVSIRHDISRRELIAAVALELYDENEPDQKITKVQVEKALRQVLEFRGYDRLVYWRDGYDNVEEAEKWATERLRPLFPEMFPNGETKG